MKIPIDRFVIRSDFREEREGLGELALSIQKDGLLQPIVVEPCEDDPSLYEIKVGRRRFTALKDYLELSHLEEGVHFVIRTGMDSLVVQLAENINREDFKPIEVARLVKAIHDRGIAEKGHAVKGKGGGWGIKDTAKVIGRDKTFVSRMLKACENEELIADCKTINEAVQTIARETKKDVLKAVRKAKVSRVQSKSIEELLSGYVCRDAVSFLRDLEDDSVDLVYTDPPYGVDLDEINPDSYEDDPEALKVLLRTIVPELARVIKPDRFVIIWTSFLLLSFLHDLLAENGLHPARTPLIWTKLNATGRTPQIDKTLASAAECAIYAYSGPGAELAIKGHNNIFHHPIVRKNRVHVAQKPESLNEEIITIFSRKGDVVLDVFAGSASTLRACAATDRVFIGCEKDQEFYERGISYTLDWVKEQEQVAD